MIEDLIEQQKQEAEVFKQQALDDEMKEQNDRRKQREALIDELVCQLL